MSSLSTPLLPVRIRREQIAYAPALLTEPTLNLFFVDNDNEN